jgi:hypothetical protein
MGLVRSPSAALLVSLTLVTGLACGGRVEGGGNGGDGGDPNGNDSGTTAHDGSGSDSLDLHICPTQPPTVGMTCDSPGQQVCIYLGHDGSCESFACNAQGTWESSTEGC